MPTECIYDWHISDCEACLFLLVQSIDLLVPLNLKVRFVTIDREKMNVISKDLPVKNDIVMFCLDDTQMHHMLLTSKRSID
jgi:hypothetical protein